MDPLIKALKRLRLRLAFLQWLGHAVKGLTWGAALACAWLVVTRLFPRLGDPNVLAVYLFAGGFAVASALSIYRRPSLTRTALEADKYLGLKERLTSSYQLAGVEGPMTAALHEDARSILKGVNLSDGFPLRAPRSVRFLAVPVALYGIGVFFLPEFDLTGFREKEERARQEQKAREIHATRLKNQARPLMEAVDDQVGEASDLADALDRVAEGLAAGEINEKQAAARLSDLAKQLSEHQQQLANEMATPKFGGDPSKFGMASDVAKNIQEGKFGEAATEMKKLGEQIKEKVESGEMTEAEAKKMSADLQKLAEMMGGENSELGSALAKAAAQLNAKNAGEALEALEQMEMSMEDLQSLMEQMDAIECAACELGKAQAELLGQKLAVGKGFGKGFGEGMGGLNGPGRGRGNRIGELPDSSGAFEATMLSGDMTRGKILASIMQRTAPNEGDAESTAEFEAQALVVVQQQAEQALTKEEIPPGAREFVRQYFGSPEPEENRGASITNTSE